MSDGQARLALVVDDDDTIRQLVGNLLQMDHFKVESACDGAEALEKMKASEFAVVILDLVMPNKDGFAVLDELLMSAPESLGRIIILTALPKETVPTHPVFSVLAKPFEIHTLLRSARDCAQGCEAVN